ncbi:hypothetical protein [Pseudomonas sp. RGM 3321]|uniref:hypothetical protein n=1 Tax=Pseudomonas sp. RGM 3321 TaxID=2930089 RepID=UPI001FCA8533|nr:hypothetical protein [Pseudomonas sp. RGM 3321]MCJ2370200.1 hypothetical protein [Pseudomonas sp. RGM 3321]
MAAPRLKGANLEFCGIIPLRSANLFSNNQHHHFGGSCVNLEEKFVTPKSVLIRIAHEIYPTTRVTRSSGLLVRVWLTDCPYAE